MNITPKDSIQPIPIEEEKSEELTLFQERSNLKETLNGFKVYINQYAWDAFLNHGNNVYKQTKHEAQGIFLGKYYKDRHGEFAVATEYSEGTGESSHAYVGMSEECLAEISKKCTSDKLLMLIWVHTHPNFGVFYSGTDINCLKTNFFMPFQSGIVVDIIRCESKGFKVENNDINEFTGYYIYHSEEKRLSKPYSLSLEPKDVDIKKNEISKNPELLTKEILAEFHAIIKELAELQSIKRELTELKSILIKIPEQFNSQRTVDSIEEDKEHFGSIGQKIDLHKNYAEYFEHLISSQDKFKKFVIMFFVGILFLFCLSVIAFIYFFTKPFEH